MEITIPNKHIVGEIIHNSHTDTLAEETVGIAYDSDPDKAIAVIRQALEKTDIYSPPASLMHTSIAQVEIFRDQRAIVISDVLHAHDRQCKR